MDHMRGHILSFLETLVLASFLPNLNPPTRARGLDDTSSTSPFCIHEVCACPRNVGKRGGLNVFSVTSFVLTLLFILVNVAVFPVGTYNFSSFHVMGPIMSCGSRTCQNIRKNTCHVMTLFCLNNWRSIFRLA